MGIFVAYRVKNCQHLNRLRHDDEKRDYRPDADDSQLDTACRPSGVDFVPRLHTLSPRDLEDDRTLSCQCLTSDLIDHLDRRSRNAARIHRDLFVSSTK